MNKRKQELEESLKKRGSMWDNYLTLSKESSTLDGSFTASDLRAIADAMDELAKLGC